MKQDAFIKSTYSLLLLLLLLVGGTIAPVAAQEPQSEGDVEVQMADFLDFLWNPDATLVAQGDGTVSVKLDLRGAQQISGVTLAIGYNSAVVSPEEINPGELLTGTAGTDYFFNVQTDGAPLTCGGDRSFKVAIAYLKSGVSINGSGSLINVLWRSNPTAVAGDVSPICLDGTISKAVDDKGVPTLTSISDTTGMIYIDSTNIFKFQIGLEGGKNSGLSVTADPESISTLVQINDLYTCDDGSVDAYGFCPFNDSTVTPPYTVKVSRLGYLDAATSFATSTDSSSVFLLAGDLNNDKTVNILDLVLMANLLDTSVSTDTLSNVADFTGPPTGLGLPPAPDGQITITDLVLVAQNFGLSESPGGVTPTPAPTETPVETATPSPTETPVETATLIPTETPTLIPTETPLPTETLLPTETATPLPTDTPIPTETPLPTDTPIPTETATLLPTETPLPTDTPIPTETATPLPTDTPAPTETPLPTDTPTPLPTNTPLPFPRPPF